MAFRVDNIVVSDKNIMLCDDNGIAYVADIEKEQEILNSINYSRDKNPWNLKTEDGKIINNLFKLSDMDVRTQVLTGSSGTSKNYCQSHELFKMPNPSSMTGICQFYDSAYSISDRSDDRFSATYNTTDGEGSETYTSDDSYIKYDNLSSYDNMVDYYISPNTSFIRSDGLQYLTEYPIKDFYFDFGDNESTEKPTVYGDSCPLKYYLDDSYSVSSEQIDEEHENVNHIRTYYGIGNTGNSIYLVYRNDRTGSSTISSNDGHYVDTRKKNTEEYALTSELSSYGYMSNITTMTNSTSGMMYACDPYSDFFKYTSMSDIDGYYMIKQPKSRTFMLFFNRDGENSTKLTFVPRNGLDKSRCSKVLTEYVSASSVVELDDSVIIATYGNGVIYVTDSSYEKTNTTTTIDFAPFKYAKVGHPDYDSEQIQLSGGGEEFNNFTAYYNGSDILGLIGTSISKDNAGNHEECRVAFVSTTVESSSGTYYGIGSLFSRLSAPDYSIATTTVDDYSPWSTVISSVPTSTRDDTTGDISWKYVLSSVTTHELTGTHEVSSYDYHSNRLPSDSSQCPYTSKLMFDYSPIRIDGETEIGNYVFAQFSNYGLAKCHVGEIYNGRNCTETTTTGPANRKRDVETVSSGDICCGAHFLLINHNDSSNDSTLEMINFIGSNSNSRIYGKPSLVTTYRRTTAEEDSSVLYNAFSLLPFDDTRTTVKEPSFCAENPSREVEQSVIDNFKFILDKPIEKSMGVSVRDYGIGEINHDASVSLVSWNNSDGKYSTDTDYMDDDSSVGGLHLQYEGICTEVYVNGKNTVDSDSAVNSYSSTIYEYPHRCFGDLKTAGTGLSIFDGELSSSMTVGDIQDINGYLVVKNYCVKNNKTNIIDGSIRSQYEESGKVYYHDTGSFTRGGYVVTNFFASKESNIPSLYESKLISSSKNETKTSIMSETIYDYNYLWHIVPSNPIVFYPESTEGKQWRPYYAEKYVDFIKYHNGYYYIALSKDKEKNSKTVGYELIETDSLFDEKDCTKLEIGEYVSGIEFFGDNVAVEYTSIKDDGDVEKNVMWFKSGKSEYKTYPMAYCNTSVADSESLSSINRSSISVTVNNTVKDSTVTFDNIEVIHSMNRFSSVVNHKSSIFSVKISDLGLDSSSYFSDEQKKRLKKWLQNRITTIVDSVKPAHTQLFDVFID